jgi:hypothetical protein
MDLNIQLIVLMAILAKYGLVQMMSVRPRLMSSRA